MTKLKIYFTTRVVTQTVYVSRVFTVRYTGPDYVLVIRKPLVRNFSEVEGVNTSPTVVSLMAEGDTYSRLSV